MVLPLINQTQSSAYSWIQTSGRTDGRSLIYWLSISGPRIDPCGTPPANWNNMAAVFRVNVHIAALQSQHLCTESIIDKYQLRSSDEGLTSTGMPCFSFLTNVLIKSLWTKVSLNALNVNESHHRTDQMLVASLGLLYNWSVVIFVPSLCLCSDCCFLFTSISRRLHCV